MSYNFDYDAMMRGLMRAPLISKLGETPTEEPKEVEYIWIEGYKGTDKNMCCRDFQYRFGTIFEMPDDTKIELCHSGFHLCPQLGQVFSYYKVGNGNRFFKVRALVPKNQTISGGRWLTTPDKYAAKAIQFMHECDINEILSAAYDYEKIKDLTDDERLEVLATSLGEVNSRKVVRELVGLGYSEEIAKIAYENDREYLARALATQTNIGWDTRILALMTSNLDD